MIEECLKGWELIVEKTFLNRSDSTFRGIARTTCPSGSSYSALRRFFLKDFTIIVTHMGHFRLCSFFSQSKH